MVEVVCEVWVWERWMVVGSEGCEESKRGVGGMGMIKILRRWRIRRWERERKRILEELLEVRGCGL